MELVCGRSGLSSLPGAGPGFHCHSTQGWKLSLIGHVSCDTDSLDLACQIDAQYPTPFPNRPSSDIMNSPVPPLEVVELKDMLRLLDQYINIVLAHAAHDGVLVSQTYTENLHLQLQSIGLNDAKGVSVYGVFKDSTLGDVQGRTGYFRVASGPGPSSVYAIVFHDEAFLTIILRTWQQTRNIVNHIPVEAHHPGLDMDLVARYYLPFIDLAPYGHLCVIRVIDLSIGALMISLFSSNLPRDALLVAYVLNAIKPSVVVIQSIKVCSYRSYGVIAFD